MSVSGISVDYVVLVIQWVKKTETPKSKHPPLTGYNFELRQYRKGMLHVKDIMLMIRKLGEAN
jgi:hypothetical protein